MHNTLLLHIGRPKTGTSALQTFLYENEENLEEHGWCYPHFKDELSDIYPYYPVKEKNGIIFNLLNRKDDRIGNSNEIWNKVWNPILNHLKKKNVIISEEGLWRNPKEFWIKVKERYDHIKVVVYLRRQDRVLESEWNQHIKANPDRFGTFQECIELLEENVELVGLQYKKQLDQICEVIGKENLIVRVYEKQQFCGSKCSIESDFLSVIGIEPDWSKWKECLIENMKISGNYLEIKRIYNSIQRIGDIKFNHFVDNITGQRPYSDVFMELSGVFAKEKEKEGYFTKKQRKEFMEQFACENEQIAREYLHRESGILFYDDNMDYPLYETPQYSSFEADIIRSFAGLMYTQNKRIQEENQRFILKMSALEKHNWMLARKILLCNIKGRKLLLFGAGQNCRRLLNNVNLPVELIVDNDENKMGYIPGGGYKVTHPKYIQDWFQYFIVVTCVSTDEIEEQLQRLNLKKEENYALAKEYFMYE